MRVNIYQTKNPNSWIKGCNSLSTGIAYRAGLIGVIWFFYQLDNPSIASLSYADNKQGSMLAIVFGFE